MAAQRKKATRKNKSTPKKATPPKPTSKKPTNKKPTKKKPKKPAAERPPAEECPVIEQSPVYSGAVSRPPTGQRGPEREFRRPARGPQGKRPAYTKRRAEPEIIRRQSRPPVKPPTGRHVLRTPAVGASYQTAPPGAVRRRPDLPSGPAGNVTRPIADPHGFVKVGVPVPRPPTKPLRRPPVTAPVPRPQDGPRERPDGNQMVDSYYIIMAGRRRKTVARLVSKHKTDHAIATGSLIGPSLLLTCQHTLATKANAAHVMAQFDYLKVWDGAGEETRSDHFLLRPDVFFHNDKNLDYAVCFVWPERVKPPGDKRKASLLGRKWNQMRAARWNNDATPYEQWVNIIQHPHGNHQKVALRDSQTLGLRGREERYLHYLADTNSKSSGSPVWNDRWDLVGLHHQALPRPRHQRRRRGKWLANQGVRTCQIVRSLRDEIKRRVEAETIDADMVKLLACCFKQPSPDPRVWAKERTAIRKVRTRLVTRANESEAKAGARG